MWPIFLVFVIKEDLSWQRLAGIFHMDMEFNFDLSDSSEQLTSLRQGRAGNDKFYLGILRFGSLSSL